MCDGLSSTMAIHPRSHGAVPPLYSWLVPGTSRGLELAIPNDCQSSKYLYQQDMAETENAT